MRASRRFGSSVAVGGVGCLVDVLQLQPGYSETVASFYDGGGDALFQAVVDKIDYFGVGVTVLR